MDNYKNRVTAIALGLALAWVSVVIAGFGAAVSIPAEILYPVAQLSGLLAFTLIDLFTIAIPLAAAFLAFAFFSRLAIKRPDTVFYVLLLAPLVLLHLYFLVQAPSQMLDMVMTLPRYLLLAACFFFLERNAKSANV